MDHGSILSPEYLSQDLTQISMSETAPLNPAIASDTDLENEDLCDLQETEGQKKKLRGDRYTFSSCMDSHLLYPLEG
jgi:hypothetical protein